MIITAEGLTRVENIDTDFLKSFHLNIILHFLKECQVFQHKNEIHLFFFVCLFEM